MAGRIAAALLASTVAVGGTATAASGATRFAEPGGDGPAETCPASNPCDIQVAVEDPAAGVGDDVVLLPGTYDLGADQLALDHELSVGGRHTDPRPTITGSATFSLVTVIGNSAATRLHDVAVENSGLAGVSTVQSIERVEARASLIACSPGFDGVIRDSLCISDGNFGEAVSYSGGCGGVVDLGTRRLRNVTAIATGNDSVAVAVDVNGGCQATLESRNVIAMGEAFDIAARTADVDSRAEIQLAHSAFASVDATDANEIAPAPGSGTNITAPPLLDDGFRQLPGSPTIDAGGADAVLGEFDFEGDRRVLGGRVDIGADEFSTICLGQSATLVAGGPGPTQGTPGADVIVGRSRGDDIRARGGNDAICAGGGRDVVKGGGGRDLVVAGAGGDRGSGGGAKDRLLGQAGRDRLSGGGGRGDLCHGGPGRDSAQRSCERVRGVP